jgi:ABC-2 type transport system permease protein
VIRLVLVELRRLFARRVVWLTVVGALVVVVAALVGVDQQARWVNEYRAESVQWFEEAQRDWEANGRQMVAQCELDQEAERRRTGDATVDYGCDTMRAPVESDYLSDMPSLVEQYRLALGALTYPFLFLALAMGSTSVAAEFSHRTLGSWLTFVPRRVPVFTSKVTAAALGSLPLVGVGLLLILLGAPVVFRIHGVDDSMTGEHWEQTAWIAARMVLLACAAGAFGAAAAFLLRHSGAVIGLMVGYLVLVEGVLGSMLPALGRFLLGRNIQAFVQDGAEWASYVDCESINGCREVIHRISLEHGAVELSLLLAVVLVVALVHFVRSDVE